MILLDANVLIYAHNQDAEYHDAARTWLDERLSTPTRVGLPWESALAFVRLTSNPRIFPAPLSVRQAWNTVESWLEADPVWIPTPTDRHQEVLAALIPYVGKPNHLPDAHLAALALQYGLTVISADSDFARFPSVRWHNPLHPPQTPRHPGGPGGLDTTDQDTPPINDLGW